MYPRKTIKPKEDYWEYSIDDFALYDIPAFLETIIEIKTKELRQQHKEDYPHISDEDLDSDIRKHLKIKYVGHSMGAMVLPMYLINRRL